MAKTKARPSGTGQATAVSANERARLRRNAYERARRRNIRAVLRAAKRAATHRPNVIGIAVEHVSKQPVLPNLTAAALSGTPITGHAYKKGDTFVLPEPQPRTEAQRAEFLGQTLKELVGNDADPRGAMLVAIDHMDLQRRQLEASLNATQQELTRVLNVGLTGEALGKLVQELTEAVAGLRRVLNIR